MFDKPKVQMWKSESAGHLTTFCSPDEVEIAKEQGWKESPDEQRNVADEQLSAQSDEQLRARSDFQSGQLEQQQRGNEVGGGDTQPSPATGQPVADGVQQSVRDVAADGGKQGGKRRG